MSDDTEHNNHNATSYELHDFNDDLRPVNDNIVHPCNNNDCPDNSAAEHHYHAGDWTFTEPVNNHNDRALAIYDDAAARGLNVDPEWVNDLYRRLNDLINERASYHDYRPYYVINRSPGHHGPYDKYKHRHATFTSVSQDRDEHGRSAGNWIRILVDRLGFVRNFSKKG